MKTISIHLPIFILLLITPLAHANELPKYWIFFNDKGSPPSSSLAKVRPNQLGLSRRSLARREKVISSDALIDQYDLPINSSYTNQLESLGIHIIHTSIWLNAVSVRLNTVQLKQVKKLPCIKKIQPIATFRHPPLSGKNNQRLIQRSTTQTTDFDYGQSFTQNELCHIPEAHNLGIYGYGVLVGMLDTGFNYDEHEAFQSLQVVDEYDFVNKDEVTEDESSDNDPANQHSHGTSTLSIIAGYKPGELIGPAFRAHFLLGKTEDTRSETPVEEDYWVAGLEWMERNGVDIVSSSVGYNDWYEYSDMNGDKAVTTRAADIAASKGVLIVNSMGNEGNNSWRYMIAPADGDSVVSVGAVTSSGEISYFSSIGPTYDGRIKPDVVAMGSSVYMVSANDPMGYRYSQGTSFSAPIVAGVATLVLSAHPELSPMDIREALRATADNSDTPNNQFGWGLVNAAKALYYHGYFFSNIPEIKQSNGGHDISIHIHTPGKNILFEQAYLHYSYAGQPYDSVALQRTANSTEFVGHISEPLPETNVQFYFSAKTPDSDIKTHPYNAPENYFTFHPFDSTIIPPNYSNQPTEFSISNNFPNPFNNSTIIQYNVAIYTHVRLSIYNLNGQLVKILVDKPQFPRFYQVPWHGDDNYGQPVASGVYMYVFEAGVYKKSHKLLLMR